MLATSLVGLPCHVLTFVLEPRDIGKPNITLRSFI